jgi:hypothetical protein
MADQQVGDAPLLLEIFQEIEHLRADGDIQRGDRLVQDDQRRLQGEGPSDADALPLAAAPQSRRAVDARPGAPRPGGRP